MKGERSSSADQELAGNTSNEDPMAFMPISEEEREEIRDHPSIDNVKIEEGATSLEAYRKFAVPPLVISDPWTFELPMPRDDDEVLKITWDEMATKPLPELMNLRDVLREMAARYTHLAEGLIKITERLFRRLAKEEGESDLLTEWWRYDLAEMELDHGAPVSVPKLWRRTNIETRRKLIGDRIELSRYEYAVSAARFRLQICEHVITRIALIGTVSAWDDTPEDERPRFEEPEHGNQPKQYKKEMLEEVRRLYLSDDKKRIKKACRDAIENLGVGKPNTVYQWVQDLRPLWNAEASERESE